MTAILSHGPHGDRHWARFGPEAGTAALDRRGKGLEFASGDLGSICAVCWHCDLEHVLSCAGLSYQVWMLSSL